ncbi:MAG: HYR domain-containing protein [Thaumarchaeota archaeon]|nr:HYR domain-containing protein [Nitrososphaerota archaeon]
MALVLSSMTVESAWANDPLPFVTQWGAYGLQTTAKFAFPQGIATDTAGNVYVTDLGNRRVQEFDNAGNFLSTWGMKGSGNGTFQAPEGIAVGGGSIYVVDNDLNIVEKFDMSGHFITQWGGRGSDKGQFLLPQGVAVDSKGNVYVVDTGNSRVEKFNGNGTFLSSIGSSGLDNGQFLSPHGVAVDSFDFVYVTDTGNNRVEKFSQDGTYLQSYGEGESLKSPIGIAVDKSGDIFVADDGNNRMVEFQSNGNVASWGSPGTGPDFFMEPRDVAIDSAGSVFVVDSDNNRIEKFGSTTAPPSTPSKTPITGNQTTQAAQNQNTVQSTNASLITDPSEKTAPQITSPPDMTVEATGNLTPVSVGQATATDAVKVVSITNNAPSKFPIGTTMVTWTAMNAGGNTAKAIQKITVVDTTPPTLTAPPNVTVQATSADHNTVDLGLPSSYDAVGVESVTNDAPAYFPLGQTIVTWKAVDPSGNVATAKQTVTVQDTKPPTIKSPADMTVNATGSLTQVNIGQATASDNTGISSLTNDAPQQGFPLGTTVVTWTAVDAGGNTANTTQKITVVNHTPPKLTPPAAVTFEATSLNNNTVPIGNATATDFESIAISNNAPHTFQLGKTTVIWTARDMSGNTANATQIINVVDTTAPKLTPPAAVTFEATSVSANTVPVGNATATDIEPVTITSNASKTFPLGKTAVVWTAKDTSGNTANATQLVTVVHTIPPKITAPQTVTFEATSMDNNTVPLGSPTVTDIEQVTMTNDAPKSFPIGMTTVTWTAKDTSGNTANATQTVIVKDTTAPKLTPPANITFEATSVSANTVPVGNATATDIEPVTITSNASKTFPLGKTAVVWTAVDKSGNKANATQIISVVDTTAPKIIAPQAVTSAATSLDNNTVSIGNATATDNVKVVSITNNAPKTFPLGKTTILWVATDESGNKANATQVVDVVNTSPPKLTPPAGVTFEATSLNNNAVPVGNATATDIEPVTITSNASKTFPLGKTAVVWTAVDKSGNKANATQIISVVDTTAPKIIAPHTVTVNATSPTSNTVNIGNATATDNTKVISITSNAPAVFPFGNTTVTWTAKDEAGNIATATQLIDVVDHTAPQLTIPSDIVINATSFATPVSIGQATATGIIDTSPKITNNSTGLFHIGKTAIEWTAVDKFGNKKTLDQTVNVLACGKPESLYNVIMGTNGNDTLTGSSVQNLILGLDGDDIIHAGPAGDCIIAGNGNNVIFGGSGNDMIIAGNGDNIIKGSTGNELIYVGTGSNIIQGGSGHSTCYLGNPGADTVVNCQALKQ